MVAKEIIARINKETNFNIECIAVGLKINISIAVKTFRFIWPKDNNDLFQKLMYKLFDSLINLFFEQFIHGKIIGFRICVSDYINQEWRILFLNRMKQYILDNYCDQNQVFNYEFSTIELDTTFMLQHYIIYNVRKGYLDQIYLNKINAPTSTTDHWDQLCKELQIFYNSWEQNTHVSGFPIVELEQ